MVTRTAKSSQALAQSLKKRSGGLTLKAISISAVVQQQQLPDTPGYLSACVFAISLLVGSPAFVDGILDEDLSDLLLQACLAGWYSSQIAAYRAALC